MQVFRNITKGEKLELFYVEPHGRIERFHSPFLYCNFNPEIPIQLLNKLE